MKIADSPSSSIDNLPKTISIRDIGSQKKYQKDHENNNNNIEKF